jgi:hypothetical protein
VSIAMAMDLPWDGFDASSFFVGLMVGMIVTLFSIAYAQR